MKLMKLLLPAALLLLSIDGFAGQYKADPVYIDLEQQVATGSLYATRFSSNSDERIGCAVTNGDERGLFGYCEAKYFDPDSAELLAADCFTYDDKMIEAIQSINTYSFVYFTWERQTRKGFDDNVCTNVTVATRSTHIPETAAQAQVEDELLGLTNAAVDGAGGLGAMYDLCQTEFGDGSVMCTTQQALESPAFGDLAGGGWIRPIVKDTIYFGTAGDPQDWFQVELYGAVQPNRGAGNTFGGFKVCPDDSGFFFGTVLSAPAGYVAVRECNLSFNVFCCR